MRAGLVLIATAAGVLMGAAGARGQTTPPPSQFPPLDQNCTVSVLNRNVLVNPDGSWVLPNIPANVGQVKARATCVHNGVTISGESDFFTVPANGVVNLPPILLGTASQIPVALTIASSATSLTTFGQTAQLTVTATYPDASTRDVSAGSSGTNYTISNPAIATITADGLVTAASSGTVLIQASNEGASGITTTSVVLGGSSHQGIPDSWALTYNLNPLSPTLAMEDPDRDGLTNLQEFMLGTNPIVADTDGDGLNDGDEVNVYHTNPLLADSDGDLIPDGVEVRTGTDPNQIASYDLKAATASSVITPASFQLSTSTLFPNASLRVNWKVKLIDGKTTLDLTADPRTHYATSNVNTCNFGGQPGLVFAGTPGTCTITLSQNTLSVSSNGTVQAFTPAALAFVDIPGFANNVAVSGNYAYVAAGSAGLQVVDVTDRSHPHIAASRSLSGNANDVVIAGTYAYVASGTAGLSIVDVSNPFPPTLTGSLNTNGEAWDVVVSDKRAYIANGAGGLVIADVSVPSTPAILGALPLSGLSKGVDVDPQRSLAVIARGSAGITVVDVSNPSSPAALASLAGGDVRDVALSANFAFLADYTRSFTSVDLTIPTAPVLKASTPASTGGFLQDVVVNGTFAAGADVFFVNGVPFIDISVPANPQPRLILDFSRFRDDNGTGIALDGQYVYLTAEAGTVTENGVNGTTRLYIGQYRSIQDNAGIAPSVAITAPANSSEVIRGATLTVTASATDDVAVASVTFYVNGQPVFTAATPPYQYGVSVPTSALALVLGATALDYGGNIGVASNISVTTIPDPLTTAVGRVVMALTHAPVANASVQCANQSGQTGSDGAFTISTVPTVQSTFTCTVRFIDSIGHGFMGASGSIAVIRGGIAQVGDIAISRVDTFTATGSMNVARMTHSATVLPNGKVLVAGGFTDGFLAVPTASAQLYDPATGLFSNTGSLTQARGGHTATLLPNGKVLIVGGQTSGTTFTASAEVYDPATGMFTSTGSMSIPRGAFSASLLSNGKVLIAGGINGSNTWNTSAELYDPTIGTFSPTGSLRAGRYGHNATTLLDGKVLIASGNSFGNYTGALEVYDPSAGTFSQAGSMTARGALTSVLLPNGFVLLAGGNLPSGGGFTALAQLWNPSTSAVTTIASMTAARYNPGAALLTNGKVLIAGGIGSGNTVLSSVELFDFTTNQFSATVSMSGPRYSFPAALLKDGRVLLPGGATSSNTPYAPTTAAEVFSSTPPVGDADEDGFPDVLEAFFGSDPFDPNSTPRVSASLVGEVNVTPFSVVNAASPTTGPSAEVNVIPFSILNLAGVSGQQPISLETDAAPFTVQNADPSSPLQAQTGTGGGGGNGQGGSGGGQPTVSQAEAVFFSVNNVASSAPPAALQARNLGGIGVLIAGISDEDRNPSPSQPRLLKAMRAFVVGITRTITTLSQVQIREKE